MSEAINGENDTIAEMSQDKLDSNTAAVPGEGTVSEISSASVGGRSTGVEHGSHLEDQGSPEPANASSSQLCTDSRNTDFLLTGIGGLGILNPGLSIGVRVRAQYPDTIKDELSLTGDVGERHLGSRSGSVDDPWSGVDFCVPESSIHGLVPSFCSRSGRLTTQTQLFIKHFLDPNPTGCMDHVESNCIRPHEQYAIVQRVFEAAYATLAAVAIMAIFTLQAHGLQLTWTIIYGLFVLLAAVLVVIRMLL